MFPPTELDVISVTGAYAGASASNLNDMVVQNLEENIMSVSGVKELNSVISSGFFSINAKLEENANKTRVMQKIQDAISAAKTDIPSDMNEPSASFVEMEIPLVLINIAYDGDQIDTAIKAAKELKSRLSTIEDLSKAEIRGETDKDVFFYIDLKKAQALGLDSNLLASAIANLSSIFPIGEIEEKTNNYYISTFNGEKDIDKLLNSVIKIGSKIIRVGDIAQIKQDYKQENIISSYKTKKNISLETVKSQNGNAIAIAQEIKSTLKEFQETYKNLTFSTFFDTSIYIKNRLNTVVANIFLGLILVGLAMHFLINKRISFVVVLGIPTSFLISVVMFKYTGQSINMMNLIGALIAIGVIVDDAIIVAENIQRHLEEGKDLKTASLVGTKEVLTPVLTSSLTTIFAFLPMLLISGEMGAFMRQIPIAISLLIFASLIESFIFLPLHSKHVLKAKTKEINWQKALNFYEKIIKILIAKKKTTVILFWVLVPVFMVVGFSSLKSEFFPNFDSDNITISGELPVGTSLEDTFKIVQDLERKILEYEDSYKLKGTTGMAGFRLDAQGKSDLGKNLFNIFVDLQKARPTDYINRYITPFLSFDYDSIGDRVMPSYEIADKLRQDLKALATKNNIQDFVVVAQDAGVVNNPIEILVFGDNFKQTRQAANTIKQALQDTNKTTNLGLDLKLGNPELKLRINPYGASLGLSEKTVFNSLFRFFSSSAITKGFNSNGLVEFKIENPDKNSLKAFKEFYISLENGQKIALKEVVDFVEITNPNKLYKKNSKQRTKIYSNLKEGFTAVEVLQEVQPVLDSLSKQGVEISFEGEKAATDSFLSDLLESFVLAIFLIFITLLVTFNSFKVSFVVLSVVPLSFLGIVFGHIIMGLNLSMPSFIGALGLAGVVINDGIIMIDFIRKTDNLQDLISRAKLRLRPILLTSITTFLGLSTLIFFATGQAIIMQPLAVSLGFGLFWGTILNLFYLPALFALTSKIRTNK